MSVCLPVYVCQSVGRSVGLSVSVYVRQSVCLPVYLSVCFSMSDCLCLSIYVYLSVCRYVYLCLSVCLSVYVCLSVCLLICLPIRLFPIHIPIPQTDSTAQSKPNSIIFILKVRNTYTINTEEKECVYSGRSCFVMLFKCEITKPVSVHYLPQKYTALTYNAPNDE